MKLQIKQKYDYVNDIYTTHCLWFVYDILESHLFSQVRDIFTNSAIN